MVTERYANCLLRIILAIDFGVIGVCWVTAFAERKLETLAPLAETKLLETHKWNAQVFQNS